MRVLQRSLFSSLLLLSCLTGLFTASAQSGANGPAATHKLTIAPGKNVTLMLTDQLQVHIAARGIPRARFFTQSPDGRIFLTSMYNLDDNTRGAIYILDHYDAATHTYTRITPYLTHLRNPNNVAFWTDPATQQTWLYTGFTDKLVRYRYQAGDLHPTGEPEVLASYPDYGLGYKYGGWHLTRTVAIGSLHGKTHVYVAVGSSCNYCKEREAVRAAITMMDPDGKNQQIVAHGMRNAVDLRFVQELDGGALFTSNMGDDHLGNAMPDDPFFELDSNNHPGPITQTPAPNYGWPTCYYAHGVPTLDHTPLPDNPGENDKAVAERPVDSQRIYGKQPANIKAAGTNLAAQIHTPTGADMGPVPEPLRSCEHVPPAYAWFQAHGAPLGFAYFGEESKVLHNSFLVALHGPGAGRPDSPAYRVVLFTPTDRKPKDFITGFWTPTESNIFHASGRPCGLLRLGPDRFLLSDDFHGVVYIIEPAQKPS